MPISEVQVTSLVTNSGVFRRPSATAARTRRAAGNRRYAKSVVPIVRCEDVPWTPTALHRPVEDPEHAGEKVLERVVKGIAQGLPGAAMPAVRRRSVAGRDRAGVGPGALTTGPRGVR